MTGAARQGCVLCEGPGGRLVFEGAKLRVIHAEEAGFPAFYRVVWRDHAAEFSDLDAADRVLCMEAVAVGCMPMPAGVGEWEEPALLQAARASRPASVGTSTRKRARLIERMRMKTFR